MPRLTPGSGSGGYAPRPAAGHVPKAGFVCATVLAMKGLSAKNRERLWRAAEALAEAERNGQDMCHASEHRALLNAPADPLPLRERVAAKRPGEGALATAGAAP